MEGAAVIEVTCTGGRRQHTARTLAMIDVDGDKLTPRPAVDSSTRVLDRLRGTPFGQRELAADPDRFSGLRPVANLVRETSEDGLHEKWRFVCPRCGRNVPVGDDRMRGWVGEGLSVVDVSDLPMA